MNMNTKIVIEFFGGAVKTARALKISRQAVYGWIHRERIPAWHAYQIEALSGGALKFDEKTGEYCATATKIDATEQP